jgi:uncharacterized membrane-anchored protein YhcB (DUF1043 family)
MNELFNWHDTWYVIEQNWMWLALALLIGAIVGYITCEYVEDTGRG